MNITTLIPYVRATRSHGHTYIHAAVRSATYGWQGFTGTLHGRPVRATYSGYGRSLEAGGHKYKAHLRFEDTLKPVPSKQLDHVQPA